MSIVAHERFIALIQNGGQPSERFAEFIEEITRELNKAVPIRGIGSPEGVVEARPDQRYWDESGKQMYFKDTGSGNTGWVLL